MKKNNKTKKDKPRQNITDALFKDVPHLEFISNTEVVVEGSRGVLQYSEDTIKINTGSILISFCGRNLNLRCISPSALIIDGFITGVEFMV